jgi:hypothetical protein
MPNRLNVDGVRGNAVEEHMFFPVASAIVIAVGDLLWWDTANSTVKAASSFTWDTSDVITRQKFRRYFAGVALAPHRSDEGATLLPVATLCQATVTNTSATPIFGNLVGPEDAASLLIDQKVVVVQNPSEAIGMVNKNYSAAQTTIQCILRGNVQGMLPFGDQREETKMIAAFPTQTAADKMTDIPAGKLFGGAVELLAMFSYNTVATTVQSAIMNLEKNTTNLADHTVAVGAIGVYTETDLSADSNRKYDVNDNVSIELSQASTAGAVILGVRYRRLS